MQATLSGDERKVIAAKPTGNLAAYDAYLHGLDLDARPGQTEEILRNAVNAYAEAVRLDPQFALAWAALALGQANLYFLQFDTSAARKEAARTAAETATRLLLRSRDAARQRLLSLSHRTRLAVVAWLLIQIATPVFPFLQIPDWAIRLVIVLLALGFPMALILAWAFELTPEGIKRADTVVATSPRKRSYGWIYIVLIGAALSTRPRLYATGRRARPALRPGLGSDFDRGSADLL